MEEEEEEERKKKKRKERARITPVCIKYTAIVT